jgi:hypothetical protein
MQETVRQRGLTVVDVGDDAEVADVGGVHGCEGRDEGKTPTRHSNEG